MERACNQHMLWEQVHAVPNVAMVGINYEHDMEAGCHFAYASIAAFFRFKALTAAGRSLSMHCPLASTIQGFEAFRERLLPQLRFMADEAGEKVQYQTFTKKMASGCEAFSDKYSRGRRSNFEVGRWVMALLAAVLVIAYVPTLIL